MKQKKTSFLARAAMTLAVLLLGSTGAWAQDPASIGSIQYNSDLGAYEINCENNLHDLAVYVNGTGTYSTGGEEATPHDASGLTFKMTTNITMGTESEHTPIGRYVDHQHQFPFKGTFDGMKITNLTINQPTGSYLGLFGYLGSGATVENLTLDNCNITGKEDVGGIAGFANGDYNSKVNIQNCHVNGTIQATVQGAFGLGGIVGRPGYTDITGCTVTGSVSASATGSANSLGGIVGSQGCSCTITSCENAATISGSGSYHGGIVGAFGCHPFSYSNCLNTGIVEGTSNIGAIMGEYQTYLADYFTNCYYFTTGNITAFGVDDQGNETADAPGHAERAYTIAKGDHISTITSTTASFTSTINGTKYYKNGDYTLTLTPNVSSGYSFVGYSCDGGTLTNLASENGTHTLTVYNSDVTIHAILSDDNGTSIEGAVIAAIPNKRWKGGSSIEPTVSVTLGGTQLTEGTEYFVSYTNNTAIGTATATVSGINGYTGSVSADFEIVNFPGEGTEASPYEIANEEDLQALACIVNNGAEDYIRKYLKQTQPITLTQEHTPIGKDYNHPFKGNYDGDHKTISGLRINKPETRYQGLFGYTDGKNFDGIYYKANIKYVVIENCDITGGIYTGGVVGYINEGTVKDCKVSGAIKMAEGKELYCYGGIAGSSNYGNIEDCVNTASVTAFSSCGGIIGDNSSGGKVKNCFNAGIVTGTDSNVGSIAGSNYGHLTNNYHTTATTGGVGKWNATTGTDTEGAGIAATITLGTDVSFAEQPTAFTELNSVKYYISGTEVKLNYTVPTGKFFNRYIVDGGEISNASIIDGVHVLTGFTKDLTINGSWLDNKTSLAEAGAVISTIEPLTYNAQVQHPAPEVTIGEVTLVEGDDYFVSYSEGCTNVGEHTVIVTGVGLYDGSLTKTFNIAPFNISGEGAITVSGVYDEYAKTGSAINPVPTVVCAATNNATLVDGTDYDVTYNGGCTAPGDYSLTITAKGNYTGSKSVPFTILDVSELTVYDGTNGQFYMPVSGAYANNYQKCEFVMPTSGLEDMTNKAITSMRFYLQTKASGDWGNARWRVFMKEVNFTQFTGDNYGFSGINGATIVYDGALDGTNDVMTVTFDSPYIYQGGNLLIGFYQYQKGTSRNYSYFYVKMAQSSACVQGTSSNSLDNVSVSRTGTYLPKTTFWYEDVPENVTVAMNADGIRTYASPYALDLSSVNAYVVSAFGSDESTLTLKQVTEAPANTGLLLKVASDDQKGQTIELATKTSSSSISANYLKPVLSDETVVPKTNGENTNFVLANGSYGIDWYTLSEAGAIGANKAYLQLPSSALPPESGSTRGFSWIYEDASGISSVTMDNGNGDDVWYSLNGVRLSSKPTKRGIYVKDGKKVVIK